MPDIATVRHLKTIADGYIRDFGARRFDGYEESEDGLLFSYYSGELDDDGVPAPGCGGCLLIRWDGTAKGSLGLDEFELPERPVGV